MPFLPIAAPVLRLVASLLILCPMVPVEDWNALNRALRRVFIADERCSQFDLFWFRIIAALPC